MKVNNDNYIIFNPKTTLTPKETEKKTEEKPSVDQREAINQSLTNCYNFYKEKDASFTPIKSEKTETPADNETKSKTPAKTESSPAKSKEIRQTESKEIRQIDNKTEEQSQGKVFTKDHIIKPDHYPGIQNLQWLKVNQRTMGQLNKAEWFEFSGENIKNLEGKIDRKKLESIEKNLKNKNLSGEELNKKLKGMNLGKEDIALLQNSTKQKFSEEKLAFLDSLRNKTFSKEELKTELLKKNFTEGEIGQVIKEAYKPEGGKFKEIEGAPNYRKIKGIHSTGQPTVEGIKKVLDEAGAKDKEARWINLREEPVIYIDGKPHSMRLKSEATENLKQPGISAENLKKQEDELKKDLINKAKENGGYITIHDEVKNKDGKYEIVESKIKVTEDNIKTTEEVFKDLEKDYKVKYDRVPITDEQDPEKKDVDKLVDILKNDEPGKAVIFNCHAGKGRTTTGTVIADLMNEAKTNENYKDKSLLRNKVFSLLFRDEVKNTEGEGKRLRSMLTLIDSFEKAKTPGEVDSVVAALKGEIRGNETKADEAIDRRGQVQNLREATLTQLEKLKNDPEGKEKAMTFLKRYFKIIAFNQYVKESAENGYKPPYSQWLEENLRLNGMYDRVQLAFSTPAGGASDTMAA